MERVPRSRGRAALSVRPIAVTFKMPHLRRSNSFLDSFTTKMSPLRGYYIIMPPLQCTDSFFVRHFYHYVAATRLLYNYAAPSVYRFVFCQIFLSLCHRYAAIISSCHPFSVQIRFLSDISIIMSPLRGYYIIMPPLQCTDSFFVRHFYHYVTAPRFGYRFLRKPFCEGHFRLFCFFWVSESQPVPLWREITRIVTDF